MPLPFPLSEEERRLNVTSRLLAVVSSFGGQHIVAGPDMDAMVANLADTVDDLARDGLLPPVTQPPFITVDRP